MDCIFCKIINGEIPAVKVLDEELVLAFMDINPSSRGHMLVIPKKHAENIFEIAEADLAAVTVHGVRVPGRSQGKSLSFFETKLPLSG